MRHSSWWLWLVAGGVFFVNPHVFSQEAEAASTDELGVDSNERLPVEGKNKVSEKSQTEVQEEHTVVPGDTLWDLCSKYLSNPWYWPRVWSYNPEINNPHWIFPGQKVRFYPGAGELPSEIEVSREFEVPEVAPPGEEEELPERLIEMSGKIVQAKRVSAVTLRRTAFVTDVDFESSGSIKGSFEEKEYLSEHDSIYIEFKDPSSVKVGDLVTLLRTKEKLNHPVTDKFIGYHVSVLGIAQLVRMDESAATAVISTSMEPILRGDRVVPMIPELTKNIAPKPNTVELKGYIVGFDVLLTNLGENQMVFMDQGKQQGVEEGNVFDIVRRGDSLFVPGGGKKEGTWDNRFPMEVVGRILVIDSHPTASTGLVMASLKEIHVGDRVLMSLR
jgi:hypothetical protein